MKFKFSLDPVLRVLKQQEKLQQQKLAEQNLKKRKISILQQQVQNNLEVYLLSSATSQAESIRTIRNRGVHVEMVHQEINRLRRDMNKIDVEVSKEREKLTETYKKLHTLEKLKELEYNSFSKHLAKEEQEFMDEISTQSFSR